MKLDDPKQQKLIDICFQLVLTATDKRHKKFFEKLDNEGKAKWVRDQLLQCGYPTVAVGSSWGVLQQEKE